MRKEKFELLEITGYVGILAYYLSMAFLPEKYHLLAVIFGLLLLMFVYVFTYIPDTRPIRSLQDFWELYMWE